MGGGGKNKNTDLEFYNQRKYLSIWRWNKEFSIRKRCNNWSPADLHYKKCLKQFFRQKKNNSMWQSEYEPKNEEHRIWQIYINIFIYICL